MVLSDCSTIGFGKAFAQPYENPLQNHNFCKREIQWGEEEYIGSVHQVWHN